MAKLSREREKFCNQNEKLLQHIEKICNERTLWGRCYHLSHFTGGIDVCARNEASKAYLLQHFMRRDTPVFEAARTISKSDCLQACETSTNYANEVRKVEISTLESYLFFTDWMPKNLTGYACARVRY